MYCYVAQPVDLNPIEVDMLIGSDLHWHLVTGETIQGQAGSIAVNTKLGWLLPEPVIAKITHGNNATILTVHTLHIGTGPNEQLDKTLKAFWELESLGIDLDNSTLQNHPILRVKLKDGRYEVSVPWREFLQPLPDNYSLCLRRLKGLLQRLK